jgi:hypothetical protein
MSPKTTRAPRASGMTAERTFAKVAKTRPFFFPRTRNLGFLPGVVRNLFLP